MCGDIMVIRSGISKSTKQCVCVCVRGGGARKILNLFDDKSTYIYLIANKNRC